MRILAIGDIHGCSRALDLVLAAADPKPDDQIIALGDYVDRGPDSAGVLERIIALHNTGRLTALRGNHEWMMLEARYGRPNAWLMYGGRETLASYAASGQPCSLKHIPERHWEFLETALVDLCELDIHFYVHGNVEADKPLSEQNADVVLWDKFDNPRPHISGKVMICGHTQQRSGNPLNLGHAICIDTWAYGNGWLTCLDAVSGRFWQANQRGDQQTGWIQDFFVGAKEG
jgi:serine/threonine protein phosphatase 1